MEQKLGRTPVVILTIGSAIAAYFLRLRQLQTAYDAGGRVIAGAGKGFGSSDTFLGARTAIHSGRNSCERVQNIVFTGNIQLDSAKFFTAADYVEFSKRASVIFYIFGSEIILRASAEGYHFLAINAADRLEGVSVVAVINNGFCRH